MTDTIDDVAAEAVGREPVEPAFDEQGVAEQLVAQAREKGIELVGPEGLLSQLTKRVLETALEAEMSDHLGYDKHHPTGRNRGNSRNGLRSKTVLTEIGPVEIEVPRDVDATFSPTIVKKRQRRLTGVDQIVLSLSARGLTTGEISAHFTEVYGASVSRETVSKITDQVLEEMSAWMNRPLDEVYPVIFIDAIVVKVRDGQVRNKPIYVVIGVTVNGERDILGLWVGDGNEGAKFWLQVLTELKNRGVADVCIAVCDGLNGLPDAINTVWELTTVQACIIHLIRNTFRYGSRKYWDQIAHDLRPVYTAATEAEARARFEEFAEKWGKPYPAIKRLWENAWSEFVPFLDYGACCRMRVLVVSVGVVARAWLMAKEFRPVRRDQVFLMPPDMREWLPSDHLVWFILDTLEALDLTGLEATRRRGGVGAAGYDPRMLLGLLMYGYCRGVRSSRQIERLCGTDVAFRVLCAQDVPDHCTLARFRADCQDGFTSLFTQVLMIAGCAGLARFGTVAIDGTKIAANASIDANRGQEWLALEVDRMVTDAEQVDAQEDVLSAQGHLPAEGDRLPATLTDGQGRRARIRAAAAEVTKIVEQQAQADQVRDAAARQRRERAEAGESVIGRIPAGPHRLAEALAHLDREVARQQAKLEHRAAIIAAGKKPMGAPPVPVEEHSSVIRARRAVEAALVAEDANTSPASSRRSQAKKLPRTVANITDPSSRLMPTRRGFLQGYNAQVAVTSDQIIAAVQVGQSPNDMAAFTPMMSAAEAAARNLHEVTGRPDHTIGVVLADAGYCSDANLASPGPDRLIAISKNRDQLKTAREHSLTGPPWAGATPRQAMEHRLRTVEGMALYKRRGATVEPGIGNLKKIIDRFTRRGLDAVASELHLAATAFNLMKIHRSATTG